MTTEPSQLDQPTLRIQLDRLGKDREILSARFKEENDKLESLKNAIEQYRGALSYNQNLIDGISKELKGLNDQAFSSKAKSLSEIQS